MEWETLDPPIFNDTTDATPTFDARSRFRRHQIDKPLAATTIALRRRRSCDPKHRPTAFFCEETAARNTPPSPMKRERAPALALRPFAAVVAPGGYATPSQSSLLPIV